MDGPKNIKIPEHWRIDTGVTTYWPHKEGIWVNKDTAPVFYLICVYQALLDIPEAKRDLAKCNEQFINEFAGELISLFNPVMQQARTGKKVTLPGATERDAEKVAAIYKPWVEAWALSSPKMLDWVVGSNLPDIILNLLRPNFSRQELRQLQYRLAEISRQYSSPWVWKVLLRGEPSRIEETTRKLARRVVQSKGFNNRKEITWITRARWWVIVRVFKLTESQLDQMLGRGRDISSYSHDLELIDQALGFDRVPGTPMEKQRGIEKTDILRVITEYERKMRL